MRLNKKKIMEQVKTKVKDGSIMTEKNEVCALLKQYIEVLLTVCED